MRTAYRLMTLAYPWLGLPMEILRVRRMSAIPFLIGHATQIVVYYVLYEGLQVRVWHCTAHCHVVWCGVVWCGVVWCGYVMNIAYICSYV